jgi:hypothetical protein
MTDTDVEELSGLLPEVWTLLGNYARFVDGRDAAAWSRLFAEKGVLQVGDREIVGRAALEEFGANSAAGVHLQGVPGVEVGSDGTFRVTSNFYFINAGTGALLAGEYRDLLERSADGLVFTRRAIDMRARRSTTGQADA